MRRRLLTALVGVVSVALLVVGIFTVVLVRLAAFDATVEHLEKSATTLAAVFGETITTDPQRTLPDHIVQTLRRENIQTLRRALDVENIGVLVVWPQRTIPPGVLAALPEGLTFADLSPELLISTGTSSGSVGDNNAWAAAAVNTDVRGPSVTVIVVVSSALSAHIGPSGQWFLVAAVVTIAGAVVVAIRLSRNLAKPLVEVAEATHRIADGDLQTRLPAASQDTPDEIAELARAVNVMAENLERSRGLERQFLLSVSHDLRTPMTSIQGYAEALSDGTIDDAQWAGDVILGEARRLDRLIHDLLDLARLDSRRFKLDLHPADVGVATERAVNAFRTVASDAEVDLRVSILPGTALARIDSDRWGQIVGNLIENALRHASGHVDIEVAKTPGHVHMSVSDDGPGIAAEDLPHVFERLYVSKGRPAGQESGSGLGLAIVRELVHAMGGTVSAESVVGEATKLTITVPALS